MDTYTTNQFKSGLKILLDNKPHIILDNEVVKPGKGQAFNRVKVKNLLTQKVLEKTFKSGESVSAADVIETEFEYLYKNADKWVFMNPSTFEQVEVAEHIMSLAKDYIQEQDMCLITSWNNEPILVLPPNFVEVKIVKTDPGVKGDTASGGTKPAEIATGAIVKIPLFVQEGEIIKIDTRTNAYVSRAK